ncbi:MAG TPA: hypothetical protein EYN66_22370 [Myxococcales bacterium]|nr:hypothetical protein [Myxococcales bacterium]
MRYLLIALLALGSALIQAGCSESDSSAPTNDVVSADVPEPKEIAEDTSKIDTKNDDIETPEDIEEVTEPEDVEDDTGPEDVEDDTGPEDVTIPQDSEDVAAPDDVESPTDSDDSGDTNAPKPACQPPLEILPVSSVVLPYETINLAVTGGSGKFVYELIQNQSDAVFSALLGVYISGSVRGSVDIIKVTDSECIGEAQAEITVPTQLAATQNEYTIPINSCLALEYTGGSDSLSWIIQSEPPVGSLTETGIYQSKAGAVTELVRLSDNHTGEWIEFTIETNPELQISTDFPNRTLPVGAQIPLNINSDGSNFETQIQGDSVSIEDGLITAKKPGVTSIDVADNSFVCEGSTMPSPLSLSMTVTVIDAIETPRFRIGSYNTSSEVVTPGDLNADGFPDAVVGMEESTINAYRSGAVYVYAGTAEGFNQTPVQVLSSSYVSSGFGRAVTVEDITGDGIKDLVVGVAGATLDKVLVGAVYVYAGVQNGFFSEEPILKVMGTNTASNGNEYWGQSVAVCDTNNDGYNDLVVGAKGMKDPEANIKVPGAILVFAGSEEGLSQTPSTVSYGWALDENSELFTDTLYLGTRLAVGDMNNDGACDVLGYAPNYRTPPQKAYNYDGAVLLYLGQKDTGLSAKPSAIWGREPGGNLKVIGSDLAVSDINGDGRDDLLLSANNSNHSGIVGIFEGQPEYPKVVSSVTPLLTAPWTVTGGGYGKKMGYSLAVADSNGDSLVDVMIGTQVNWGGSINDAAGAIRVYPGTKDALPDTEATIMYTGMSSNDRFGEAFGVLGDLDGDTHVELFVMTGGTDEIGPDVGQPWFVPGSSLILGDDDKPAGSAAYVAMEMPGKVSGSEVGRSVRFSTNQYGAGIHGLAVGAPLGAIPPSVAAQSGGVHWYEGPDFSPDKLDSFTSDNGVIHKAGTWKFGSVVRAIGDFDGDGVPDWSAAVPGINTAMIKDSTQSETPCVHKTNWGQGALLIYSGKAGGGVQDKASFAFWGITNGIGVWDHHGKLDLNGDSKSDIIVHMPAWKYNGSTQGPIVVLYGRESAFPDKIHGLCPDDGYGLSADGSPGYRDSVAVLGDLNGDGCDEAAFGLPGYDGVQSNIGGVRVLFGWGEKCTYQEPHMLHLASANADHKYYVMGSTVFGGGHDINGDQVPDLMFSAPYAKQIYLLDGAYLKSLTPEPWKQEKEVVETVHEILPNGPDGVSLSSWSNSKNFGLTMTLIGAPVAGMLGAVAVSTYEDSVMGNDKVGTVAIHGVTENGLEPVPWQMIYGETLNANGRFGISTDYMDTVNGGLLAIGAPGSSPANSSDSVGDGAVYLFTIPAQ